MLGIEGYDPAWHHDAEALAAVHRTRFVRLVRNGRVPGEKNRGHLRGFNGDRAHARSASVELQREFVVPAERRPLVRVE